MFVFCVCGKRYVNKCNIFLFFIKVFEKFDVKHDVRLISSIKMYNMWPGCYSFRDEIKLFLTWFKDQVESLIFKIYELERLMNG